MRLICKGGGQLWRRPAILGHSGTQEGDNSGQKRRNLRFRGQFGPYRYRDWYIFTPRPPEFTPCWTCDATPGRTNFAARYTLSPNHVKITIQKMRKVGKLAKMVEIFADRYRDRVFRVWEALVSNRNNAECGNSYGSGCENGWN